jgi:hypothetical protein
MVNQDSYDALGESLSIAEKSTYVPLCMEHDKRGI